MDKNYLDYLTMEDVTDFLTPALASQDLVDDIESVQFFIEDDIIRVMLYTNQSRTPAVKIILNSYACMIESIDKSIQEKFDCDAFYTDWKDFLAMYFDDYLENLNMNSDWE